MIGWRPVTAKRTNRVAWVTAGVLAVVLLAGGVMVTVYLHRLFGPDQTVLFLQPSQWGFGRSYGVLTTGTTIDRCCELYNYGFCVVQVERPVTKQVLTDLCRITGKTHHTKP
jgi:hypothetical protein